MRKLTNMLVCVVILFAVAIQAQTLVDQWGSIGGRTGGTGLWKIYAGAPGDGSTKGTGVPAGQWATIRGGFASVTATTSQAFVITGQIEFVGAGPVTWSGLRYGVFRHDSVGTLLYAGTDTARWSGKEADAWGYMFTPHSGTNDQVGWGNGGNSTQGVAYGGNWISTFGSTFALGAPIPQAPARALFDAGKYDWAISVQPLANGDNEVRFYMVKQGTPPSYWYGGTLIDTSGATTSFNGVCFGLDPNYSESTSPIREMNLTNVQVGLGSPITIPEAPFEPFYIDLWGHIGNRRGGPGGANVWKIVPDPVIGNVGIAGAVVPAGQWATVRGGFPLPITATESKAIKVTGVIEFVGSGPVTWSGLRYGLFRHDSIGTLTYANTDSAFWGSVKYSGTDSAQWTWGKENDAYGYMFTPHSGTNDQVGWGNGGNSTQGVCNGGTWLSSFGATFAFGGPIAQAPARAIFDAGKYNWAISVQPLPNGDNEVRFYMVKQGSPTTYWYGGTLIDTSGVTKTFNGVAFGLDPNYNQTTSPISAMYLYDVFVDLGDPITVPPAPWSDFYVEEWGVVGGKTGGWKFMPDPFLIIGNAGIGGTSPNTGLAAIRGGLSGSILPPPDKTLKFTGKLIFEGGGFEGASALRFGIMQGDAGNLQNPGTDSARWGGSEANHSGYLFMPPSGSNPLPTWGGTASTGSWGAVSKSVWYGPDSSASNYVLGNEVQLPANAAAGAGTYNFTIEVQVRNDGINVIGYSLAKADNSYSIKGFTADTHNPRLTDKFNSIAFALNNWSGSTTTAMRVEDVFVSQSTTFTVPVELTAFSATLSNLDVTLNWSTATEVNNYGFEVQRRVVDGEFATVAFIKGHGTTSEVNNYSFVDRNLDEGMYFYRLKQMDFNGQYKYSNIIEVEVGQIYKFTLDQNYPNPFNPATTISYILPEKTNAKLILLNSIGEQIATLVNEVQDKGLHKVTLDGTGLSSGVYFYKLIANDLVSVKKLILMK